MRVSATTVTARRDASVPRVGTAAGGGARKGSYMRQVARIIKQDNGMSTAEYAVGTVAAAGLGGILIKLLTSGDVRDLIWSVLSKAFSSIFG
jgi:patatin-like phospholipase/acyl hydrolase